MKRLVSTLCVCGVVGSLLLTNGVSATPVDPLTKACLDKTVGVKATNAIIAAKKLTAKQKTQVTKCTNAGGSAPGGSASGGSSGSSTGSLKALNYGLMWSIGSSQGGLGNVADPALLQMADGSLRMYFKNGNESQIGIAGFDNKIHSYVSTDSGNTWTLESGVRIDVQSPVSVNVAASGGYEAWGWLNAASGDTLSHFTSSDGLTFTRVGGNVVSLTACKSLSGAAASALGDPQMVKVAGGYLAYAQDGGAGSPPFRRHACALTSTDGNTWAIDATRTLAYSNDIQTNPETYKNRSGQIEQILPIDKKEPSDNVRTGLQVRTSTNDGASWSELSELSFFAADPDRLDLADGSTSLLAFGNFDHRKGGLLALTKKISTAYKASRTEPTLTSVSWTISGASKADITIKNLCTGTNMTASATFTTSGSNIVVSLTDAGAQGTGCIYALIGSQQAIS